MQRDIYPRHFPHCPKKVALVDQYLWAKKDASAKLCENGVSHPVYTRNGEVSFSLPLELYPGNQIHPHIDYMRRRQQAQSGEGLPFEGYGYWVQKK